MKKIISFLLIVAMLFANVYAAVVEVNIGGIKVNSLNDGKTKTILLEEIPYINASGRTMVPIRAITESFGASVSWNEEKREVEIADGENVIVLAIDSTISTVNGEECVLDSAPEIKGGRTFVPLRFIGEAFGYNLKYVASTKQVVIDDTEIVFRVGDATFTMAELGAFYDIYYQIGYDGAMAQGATEEQVKMSALYAALELGIRYTVMKGTFPEATLSEDDIKSIIDNIEEDNAYITLPLEGVFALCHEMLYYSNGIPALNLMAESDEVIKIVEENFIRAKHILVDDETTAEEVLAKIAAGYDFDELVTEYGKDPGMERNKDGYVFTYGEMVKPFEDAAFALSEGEVSLPVKSDFGYHIIKREPLGEIPVEIMNFYAEEELAERLEGVRTPELLVTEEEIMEFIG